MLNLLGSIAIMMAMSFAIGMAVAFIIRQTTKSVEYLSLMHDKRPILRRANKIHRASKKIRKREINQIERSCHVEMVDHYYGDNTNTENESEMVEHFYPSK